MCSDDYQYIYYAVMVHYLTSVLTYPQWSIPRHAEIYCNIYSNMYLHTFFCAHFCRKNWAILYTIDELEEERKKRKQKSFHWRIYNIFLALYLNFRWQYDRNTIGLGGNVVDLNSAGGDVWIYVCSEKI